jgi:hypothetical protein
MISSSKVSYKKELILINGERNSSFGYRDLDRIFPEIDNIQINRQFESKKFLANTLGIYEMWFNTIFRSFRFPDV